MLNRLVQPGGNVTVITQKQMLARIYGITENQVVYLESGQIISADNVLYHPDTETVWDAGSALGTITGFSLNGDGSGNVVTSTGSFTILPKRNMSSTNTLLDTVNDQVGLLTTAAQDKGGFDGYGKTAGDDLSVEDQLTVKGQFDLNPAPEDIQAVAGINFGGKKNLGTLLIDNRGRVKTGASIDGHRTARNIHLPFSEGTGYWRGPYQDVIARFPIDGQADDETSPGIMFSYDKNTNLPRVFSVSPLQTGLVPYTDPGRYRWSWANGTAVRELAQLDSIGRSLGNSYDTYFTVDSANANFINFATIVNPTNLVGARFTCLINIGNATAGNVLTYILDVNLPDVVTAFTQYNINKYVRFTGIGSGKLLDYSDVKNVLQPVVGLVQDTATGTVNFYLRTPAHSTYLSSTCINSGNPALITWNWNKYMGGTQLTSLSGTTPVGILWANTAYTGSNYRRVLLNDGSSFDVPEGYAVLRCHYNHPADSVINAAPFKKYVSSFCYASTFEAGVDSLTCTIPSLNFTITGADLATDMPWQIRLPPMPNNANSYRYVIGATDTTNHTFSFSVRQVLTTATLNTTTNAITVNEALSTSAVDLGNAVWIDVLVKLAN